MNIINRKTLWPLAALALFSTAWIPAWAEPLSERQKRSITGLIVSSQKAGIERLDAGAYLVAFDKSAKWIVGRSEKPGPHDMVLTWEPVAARARVRERQAPWKLTMRHENIRVSRRADGLVEVRLSVSIEEGRYLELLSERYILKDFGNNDWRIVENRTWPEMTRLGLDVTFFSAATWKRLDAAVEEARSTGGRPLVIALMEAWRMPEAHKAAVAETDALTPGRVAADPQTAAALWALRADLAFRLADMKDARAALATARRIDPKLRPPIWGHAIERP